MPNTQNQFSEFNVTRKTTKRWPHLILSKCLLLYHSAVFYHKINSIRILQTINQRQHLQTRTYLPSTAAASRVRSFVSGRKHMAIKEMGSDERVKGVREGIFQRSHWLQNKENITYLLCFILCTNNKYNNSMSTPNSCLNIMKYLRNVGRQGTPRYGSHNSQNSTHLYTSRQGSYLFYIVLPPPAIHESKNLS